MSTHFHDMTPLLDPLGELGTGPLRSHQPHYVSLLPPCNQSCPAGENIQAWLSLAQAGQFQNAWLKLVEDNPFPAIAGRVCYHPCESNYAQAVSGCTWPQKYEPCTGRSTTFFQEKT